MKRLAPRVFKIAYIMTPITFGGLERVNLNFLINADRDRFVIDPILFLRPWENETVFETELKRFRIGYIPIPVSKTDKIDIFRVVRCFFHLKKYIEGNNYDLIHTHGYLADFFGYLVSKTTKIPIMSTCHGFINEDVKLSFYNYMDKFILKYFNKIIVVSEQIKNDLTMKGIVSNKISVVINSAQMNTEKKNLEQIRTCLRSVLNVKQNEIIIGYVGRLSKEKGLIYLLEAIAILKNQSLSVKLLLIGDGAQKDELNLLAKSLNITNNIVFAGFQTNVDEWVASMDYFVLPSLTEGTPMALLEVMSQGVPCIASAVGGIPQIIDSGVDGILVAPGMPNEICDAILGLIRDNEVRDIISNNAKRKILAKYNINEWTQKIEKEYENLIPD